MEADLQPLNHGLNSAWRLAQDRERWKQLVETATLQSGACPRWWWWWTYSDASIIVYLQTRLETCLKREIIIGASLAKAARSHKAEIVKVAYLKLSTLNVNIPAGNTDTLHFWSC